MAGAGKEKISQGVVHFSESFAREGYPALKNDRGKRERREERKVAKKVESLMFILA